MIISRFLRTFFCVQLVFFTSSLFAQEYVVTASRNSEDILDSPANTIFITAEQIEKSGKSNLVQLLKDVPILNITSMSSDAQAQISMRGFGENAFGRVLVMIDGRRINNPDMSGTNLLSVPLASIERIEIVDGPSSALYGNNAVAGTVNIITKESADKLSGTVALSAGSSWTFNPQFTLSSSTESTGFSVSIDQYNTEGWRDRTAVKSTNALINSYFDLTDSITLKPSLFFTDAYYELPGSLSEEQFKENPQQAINQNDDSSLLSLGSNLSLYWDMRSNLNLQVPLSYEFKAVEANFQDSVYPFFSDTNQQSLDFKPRINYLPLDSQLLDVTITGGFDSALTLYERASFTDKARKKVSDKINTKQFLIAPYIQTKLSFNVFSISAAVRYDTAFLDMQHSSNKEDSIWHFAPAYSVEALYRPIEQFSVYLRASSLFRYPFLDEVINVYVKDPINDNLEPETGYNAEIGLKTEIGRVFSASLNGYFMPIKNEIWYNPTTFANENYPNTMRVGGSILLRASPFDFFTARISASYTYATFSNGLYKNKQVPLVPKFSALASIDYTFAGLTFTPDILFKSESFQGGDNANAESPIPSYFLLGLTVSYSFEMSQGTFLLIAQAQNILNTIYSPYMYNSSYTGSSYYSAAGRSLSLSGRYSF